MGRARPPTFRRARPRVPTSATLFEGDLAHDKEFLACVLDRIVIYPDGNVSLQFKEEGLFAPVVAATFSPDGRSELPLEQVRQVHREKLRLAKEALELAPSGQIVDEEPS